MPHKIGFKLARGNRRTLTQLAVAQTIAKGCSCKKEVGGVLFRTDQHMLPERLMQQHAKHALCCPSHQHHSKRRNQQPLKAEAVGQGGTDAACCLLSGCTSKLHHHRTSLRVLRHLQQKRWVSRGKRGPSSVVRYSKHERYSKHAMPLRSPYRVKAPCTAPKLSRLTQAAEQAAAQGARHSQPHIEPLLADC